jgi:hypothetical protein
MPHVVIRTGILAEDGREETLTMYQCDWPDCPNAAERVLGSVKEIGVFVAVCAEHATRRQDAADAA